MKRRFAYAQGIIIIILSMIVAISLTCSMSIDAYYISNEGLEDYSMLMRFLTKYNRSLSQERILPLVIAGAAGILIRWVKKRDFAVRERVLSGIFAVCFSMMQLIGRSYADNNSWDALFYSRFVFFRAAVIFIGLVTLSYYSILASFRLLDCVSARETTQAGSFPKKQFFIAVAFVLICWLPYYIYFFPGTGNADTAYEIMQYFHRPYWGLSYSPVRADDIFVTNHFPYFMTVIYGVFTQIGLWLGSASYGVALYGACQMVLLAFICTGTWFYLRWIGLSEKLLKGGILFTAFFPLYPLYAICMLKDPFFSAFCLVLSVMLFEVVRTKGKVLEKRLFTLGLFVSTLFMILSKNQGVYIMAIVAVAFLICYRRYWIRIIIALLVPVLFFQLIWLKILLPAWNVAPGGKQEMLSVLLQQTARYVVEYPEDVSKEEEEAIRHVINYDQLPERYNPVLSDPIKLTFNQDVTSEELSAYYRAWMSMLKKHPDSYVQALLNNCYGFFYMAQNSGMVYFEFANRADEEDEIYINNNPTVQKALPTLKALQTFVQKLPLINVLFSVSVYCWTTVYFFLNSIRKKKYEYILAGLITIISMGILLLCPANANSRYIQPLFFAFPFLAGLCIIEGADKSGGEEKELREHEKSC